MQHYPSIPPSNTLTESREKILSRDDALLSCFSGDEFPSVNLIVGMLCYRTDTEQLYQLKNIDGPTWKIIANLKETITSQAKLEETESRLVMGLNESHNRLNQGIIDVEDKVFNKMDEHYDLIDNNGVKIINLDQRCDDIVDDAHTLEQNIKNYIDSQVSDITLPSGVMMFYTSNTGAIPEGWLGCNGQAVSRISYANLFGVLDIAFGDGDGDGDTTFNLPDMRGRVPMGIGQGEGLSNRTLNQKVGAETHTLTEAQMPSHNHNQKAKKTTPGTTAFTVAATDFSRGAGSVVAPPAFMLPTGGNQPHPIIQPSLGLMFMIKT